MSAGRHLFNAHKGAQSDDLSPHPRNPELAWDRLRWLSPPAIHHACCLRAHPSGSWTARLFWLSSRPAEHSFRRSGRPPQHDEARFGPKLHGRVPQWLRCRTHSSEDVWLMRRGAWKICS